MDLLSSTTKPESPQGEPFHKELLSSGKAELDSKFYKLFMEPQSQDAASLTAVRVKASLRLGSETYNICASKGILSEQLVSMKEESMSILKDYITKHNAPADVPDEPLEGSSGDEDEISDKPKLKKRK